ncbi:MAG: CBS domain-containing protein [Candidatus ainarchaeum sp.]|nr:CBS domain-containing protein [Candidatus ainarchaeum sp.]MDD5095969.1 CBS domain-containing protein [Candidatus ainarchaeum sp.]
MDYERAAIFDGEEPLSKALSEVVTGGTIAVVTKGGKYYGIIDDRQMRGGIHDSSKAKCINMAVRAPPLSEEMGTMEMMDRFLAGHFKALPVVRAGAILGAVSRAKLLEMLIRERAIPKMSVDALMNSPIYSVDANESVAVARRVMKSMGVHRLAITEGRKIVGTVSTMDISRALLEPKGRDFMFITEVNAVDGKPVRQMMRDKFVSVSMGGTLHEAAKKMAAHSVSAITVMDGDKPVGVVTARDVMKFLVSLHSKKPDVFISGLSEDEMGNYDLIISELRKAVANFLDTFEIDSINVRIKRGKSTYVVNTHVEMDQPIPLKVESYDLGSAISGTAAEIKSLLTKRKAYMKMKKRSFR